MEQVSKFSNYYYCSFSSHPRWTLIFTTSFQSEISKIQQSLTKDRTITCNYGCNSAPAVPRKNGAQISIYSQNATRFTGQRSRPTRFKGKVTLQVLGLSRTRDFRQLKIIGIKSPHQQIQQEQTIITSSSLNLVHQKAPTKMGAIFYLILIKQFGLAWIIAEVNNRNKLLNIIYAGFIISLAGIFRTEQYPLPKFFKTKTTGTSNIEAVLEEMKVLADGMQIKVQCKKNFILFGICKKLQQLGIDPMQSVYKLTQFQKYFAFLFFAFFSVGFPVVSQPLNLLILKYRPQIWVSYLILPNVPEFLLFINKLEGKIES